MLGQLVTVLGPDGVAGRAAKAGQAIMMGFKQDGVWGAAIAGASAVGGKIGEIAGIAARAGQAIMKNLAEGNVWGAVVAGVTAAVSVFAKLFGGATEYEKRMKKAAEETTKLQAGLVSSHGGMEQLIKDADKVGINIREAFTWQTDPEALKEVIADLEARTKRLSEAMEKYGLTWKDMGDKARDAHISEVAQALHDDFEALTIAGADTTTTVRGMSGALNDLVRDALTTGAQIPPGMQPIIEQLIQMGLLTEQNAAAMLGLAETSGPSLKQIEEAANRYGIKLDALGSKVAQLQITETAAQVLKDFELLQSAGADMGAVFAGSADEIQKLITAALQSGATLPESLRPFIQQMVDAGLLTDQTGERLTSLGALNFAEPLSKSVDRLIEKLNELIAGLTGGVGGAIDEIAKRRVNIPIGFTITEPEGSEPDPGVPGFATGGRVSRPTFAVVGERPETIVPDAYLGDLASALADRGAGGGITVSVSVDARGASDPQAVADRTSEAVMRKLRQEKRMTVS